MDHIQRKNFVEKVVGAKILIEKQKQKDTDAIFQQTPP